MPESRSSKPESLYPVEQGRGKGRSPSPCAKGVADDDDEVALHAIAGIGDMPRTLLDQVAELLSGNDREAASAAALLSYQGEQGARVLLEAGVGEGARASWALAGLGAMDPNTVKTAAGGEVPEKVRQAVEAMWRSGGSWLCRFEADSPLTSCDGRPFA
jgi:hypothetical protein